MDVKEKVEKLIAKCETLTAMCLRFAVGEDEVLIEKLAEEIADEILRMSVSPDRDVKYMNRVIYSVFRVGAFENRPKTRVMKRKRMSVARYRWEVASRVMWMLYDFLRAVGK